jgi:hypothetical protein
VSVIHHSKRLTYIVENVLLLVSLRSSADLVTLRVVATTVPGIGFLHFLEGGTFLRGVQGNPHYFPILVQGDAVHGIVSN